jgi:putative transposase
MTQVTSDVRPGKWAARASQTIITAVKARRGAHTVYRLAYHFVWVPRYRRKVLVGEVAQRLTELIGEVCTGRDWAVEALTVQSDHVHLFVSCPPRDAPATVMNVLKSITARELYAEYPRLRKSHWGGKLWADGYYVGSAGEHVTSELIKRYIEYQSAEDTGQNRLF